jgi:tRNA-2-methylthio-N6-dimethylallyladenosine synthase
MNVAESFAMKQTLSNKKWVEAENGEDADLIIINTCSVRETAETRALGRIAHYRALKKKITGQKLLVVGCMASRLGETLFEYGADFVIGTEQKNLFPIVLDKVSHSSVISYSETDNLFSPLHYSPGAFRTFVPIMHGCNNFCSYCIVPFVRGREVSRNPLDIKTEIDFLSKNGLKEITLLGQNVNSYSYTDCGKTINFPQLLKIIADNVGNIKRVRFLSSHPKDLSLETIKVLQENKIFCKHLHLCVQHGSNKILSLMNRKYTREKYINLVDTLRSEIPDISISTDILVGFPGETEEDFNELLDLMERIKFLYAFTYHYNPRENTAAYNMPCRIDTDIKIQRLQRVMEVQQTHTTELLKKRIGKIEEVLVDKESRKNKNELLCITERDEMLVIEGSKNLIGSYINVTIDSISGNTFRGKIYENRY